MGKRKEILEKIRRYTSSYPNSVAIMIAVLFFIRIEAALFSNYMIRPWISVENFAHAAWLNELVHITVLFPIFMKLFGWRFPTHQEWRLVWKRISTRFFTRK